MKHVFLAFLLLASLPVWSDDDSPTSAIEVRFSPQQKTLALVLDTIASARHEILVAAYVFTSKPVALALRDARKRGIDVRVVADEKANQDGYTATRFLANEGVPVRLNGRYPILHDKFIVVDGKTVQTGSFNYTAAAAGKNAENVLVIRDNPVLAAKYAAEWQRLWDEGRDLPASR